MVRSADSCRSSAAPGKPLATLALVRAQTTLLEKGLQFVLIGMALALGTPELHLNAGHFDLLAFALLPLSSLLIQGIAWRWSTLRMPAARTLLLACVATQLLGLGGATFCFELHRFWPAVAFFILFAVQSAGLEATSTRLASQLVPDGGEDHLASRLRLLVPGAIVLGTLLTGELFAALAPPQGSWGAGRLLLMSLLGLSLLQLLPAWLTPAPRTAPPEHGCGFPFRKLLATRDLRLAGLGVAYFWFAATGTCLILLLTGRQLAGSNPASLATATRFIATAGSGLFLGCLAVSRYARRGQQLDLVPAGALGLALSFLGAVLARTGSPVFLAALVCLGVSGGLLFVSLDLFLREKSGPAYRETVLPSVQWLAGAAQILAVGLAALLRAAQLPANAQFAILGLLSAGAFAFIARILPRHFLRFFFMALVRLIYRVQRLHPEHVPKEGGVLLISNHVSYVDAFLLSVACPRPVRFVIVDHFLNVPAFGWFLRLFDVIPISPTRAKEAIRTTAEALREGDLVCIFPEGQLTRTGMLNELKKGFELIVRHAQCPVLPVYMDSVWGSIFSFERFRYFSKLPRRIPYPVTVNFGLPVPPDEIDSSTARILIQDLSVEAFAERKDLRTSLGAAAIRSLRQHASTDLFVDLSQDLRRLSRRKVLTNSLAMAGLLRARSSGEPRRLGVLLPPGSMPAMLHLAALFAGRVPVHLPLSFLQDIPARDRFLSRHGIQTVVSSRTLFPEQIMPAGWLDLREAILRVSFLHKLGARLSQWLLPSFVTIRALKLHHANRDEEAVAYAGDTTGELISLSHLNLLAAVQQMDSTLVLLPGDRLLVDQTLTSTPALVFGLWYPCLKRNTVFLRSLSSRKIDPTLLLRDLEPEAVLLSPELSGQMMAAAGNLPSSIRIFLDFSHSGEESAERRTRLESAGAAYCLGYAPPALGAIVSMNTADPNSMIPHHLPQTGNLPGTAGRLLPGLAARLVSQDGSPLDDPSGPGRLAVRGISLPGIPRFILERQSYHLLDTQAQLDRQGFLTLVAMET